MLRLAAVIAASAVTLACGTLPAAAASGRIHAFGIPGVPGVRAWGSYEHDGAKVRVMVCVEDTARSVYGGAAVGLAFDSSYRRHADVSAATIGFEHAQCRVMATPFQGHLVVEALSGLKNGKVRQHGKPSRIY
jgi:hypothetical protein